MVAAYPSGVPGTFVRGDADAAVGLTDAVAVVLYLFRGGAEPDCLDAADADDSGHVNLTDVVGILSHLFRGAGPLPLPDSGGAWFDPDELPCGSL